MLHNTGPYGPNETPVNMGAPLNISQLATPMNMVQNLNNLGKMPPQPPSTAGGHFNLPNYPSYGNPPVNMSPQMHPFQNYPSLGFQPNYMPQTSTVMQNSSWQNAMLPMSLNMHGDHTPNMLNYSHLDKRLTHSVSGHKEQHYSTKTSLNIPQVPNKLYQKPSEPVPSAQTSCDDNYKPYNLYKDDSNLDLGLKSPDSLLSDNTRRKNLENTVRLIENILINTTKNREMQQNSQSYHNIKNDDTTNIETDSTQKDHISEEISVNHDVPNESDGESNELDDIPEESDDNDELCNDSEGNSKGNKSKNSPKRNSCNDKNLTTECNETTKTNDNIESEKEMEDSQRIEIKSIIKQEPLEEVERQVIVKIEQIHSWTDTDNMTPFHRDTNGVMREDATHSNIIESETSVFEALEIIKNDLKSDNYFECPHCCLLFQHPKRFLIHAKWHSFGLINDQRLEQAKEKEEKREAQRLERLEARPASKLWPCKHCDKVYRAKGSLDSHRQRYHSNRIRDCKICTKSIAGWAAWRAHQASHHTDSGYQCNECPKRFKYAHSLAKHKDTHLEKTHGCPECPKKFGSQNLLKVHMKSHERARQGASFHCTYCGKSFYDKFNLQIHERTHTNERPFVCEICNATFGCNSNLSRHLKVSHSASKPHVCSTCNRSFATALIRDRHEMRLHGDPEEFKHTCELCPSRYLKLVDLRKHIYKMHPKPKSEKATK